MAEKPNILIAVPAYRGSVETECMVSLVELARWLTTEQIPFTTISADMNGIDRARNFFASLLLINKKLTHLLFVDQDMQFVPRAVDKMLRARVDVVGCAAPKRVTPRTEFNVQGELGSHKGLRIFERVGTGLMLISRSAFERLIATGKIRMTKQHDLTKRFGFTGPLYGFFDRDAEAGEDYAFCDRWRKLCGGTVYAVVDEQIGHVGKQIIRETYSAPGDRRAPRTMESPTTDKTPA